MKQSFNPKTAVIDDDASLASKSAKKMKNVDEMTRAGGLALVVMDNIYETCLLFDITFVDSRPRSVV